MRLHHASWILPLSAIVLTQAAPRQNLPILGDSYPRAFFFRSSEAMARKPQTTYEQWERVFGRLMGIEGKALDEEIPGTSPRNIGIFTRFKQQHPDQLVMLHFNGNARDPRYQTEKYFAGHWLYYNGATILSDVPAGGGDTDIRVSDAKLFQVSIGRFKNSNEDVALCALDAQAKPDWNRCEQTTLVSIDGKTNTIRVKRALYGTKARAFQAGKAYAAAHVTEGPWGNNANLLWFYNYSTKCPRDTSGKTCNDILSDELARRFAPGGELANFDGLEFDVMNFETKREWRGRGADADGDGKIDSGVFDGINTYGIGNFEFCRMLRRKMGEDRLILADGYSAGNQRAFQILNGIESEGWPALNDFAIKDWSGGLNRHLFWSVNAHQPVFNYINHKFVVPGDKPGQMKKPDVPFKIHRLVFAVAAFTDAAVCYSTSPAADPDGTFGIWDELRNPGWLGKALGPAVRMAERQPNLLKGAPRFTGSDARFTPEDGAVRIAAAKADASEIRFHLSVPVSGSDLFVTFTARALPRHGYPTEIPRRLTVGNSPEDKKPSATWVDQTDFKAGFYFKDAKSPSIDLEFAIEGAEPLWISHVAAYAHPDAIYREFEHGLVLANPAPQPYVFNLDKLFPGKSFRRLKGSSTQDAVANSGAPVAGNLELQPQEGLFLRK
jgi:hypothetical protein